MKIPIGWLYFDSYNFLLCILVLMGTCITSLRFTMPFNLFSKCYNKGSFDRQNVLSIEEQHDVCISIYSYLSTKIVKLLLIMMD